MSVRISQDGKSGDISVSEIDGRGSSGKPIVVLSTIQQSGFIALDDRMLPEKIEGVWGKKMQLKFKRVLSR
jgi:hypothetical protein